MRAANRIRTPVLFLHALEDYRAPAAGSEALFTAVRDLGHAPTELVLYEGLSHNWVTWPLSLRFDSDRAHRRVDRALRRRGPAAAMSG